MHCSSTHGDTKLVRQLTLSQWNDGRRGQDGWGRYTRRRKWYRDAELVEVAPGLETDSSATLVANTPDRPSTDAPRSEYSTPVKDNDDSGSSQARRRGFLRRDSRTSARSSNLSGNNVLSSDDEGDLHRLPSHHQQNEDWGIGEDVRMGLG